MRIKKLMFLAVSVFALALFGATPKYVFLFIGDGMNMAHRMLANEFSISRGDGPLAMNQMSRMGLARTASASHRITDSAAAGTALACGVKTKNGRLGIDRDGNRVESCAEVAAASGKKVGIISTVMTTHATPAAFYAHRNTRKDVMPIVEDMVKSGFEYFAGGGLGAKGPDTDKAYAMVESNGYHIVRNLAEFDAIGRDGRKYITYFTNTALDGAIDAKGDQPTVKQMVDKAIEVLDNEKGFFIMCEGGRIDWYSHGNDSAAVLHDVIALDEAVKSALEFCAGHKDECLVIVTGDHETGGLVTGRIYNKFLPRTELLANQKKSVSAFNDDVSALVAGKKGDVAFDDVIPLLEKSFGFDFGTQARKTAMTLSDKEKEGLKKTFEADLAKYRKNISETDDYLERLVYNLGGVAGLILERRCGVAWNTYGHTSLPVLTTAEGAGADDFTGFYENTRIGQKIKEYLR